MNIWLLLLTFIVIAFLLHWLFVDRKQPVRTFKRERDFHFETSEELHGHLETSEKLHDHFETSEELHPIDFPPDPLVEHIPELPLSYGDTKITLMARDPEWLFAYWEINDELYHHLQEQHADNWVDSYEILRIYDITDNPNFDETNARHIEDIRLEPFSNHWYIHVGKPDRTYFVELGRILKNGGYIMLASSNIISTPRNSISDVIDPEWMLVSGLQKEIFGTIGSGENMSSAELMNNISSFREN